MSATTDITIMDIIMVPTMDMMVIIILHTTLRLMYFVVANITGHLVKRIRILRLNSVKLHPKYNDFRYAYKASSCYTCSSIDGSNDKCEYMDSKYSWDQLDE